MTALLLGLLACTGDPAPKPDAPAEDTDTGTTDSGTDSATDSDTDSGEPVVCPAERRVEGRVVGAVLAKANVYAAALDASAWRFDDATDVSDVVVPDASTGAFTLCLDEAPPVTAAYAKAVVAAWQDLDGDQRYDVKSEDLCDAAAPDGGWTMEYLFYGEGAGWSVGITRVGNGDLPAAFTPVLDGDNCQR